MNVPCPFCGKQEDLWSGEFVIAVPDLYPVGVGHTLILPRRHCATWFEATSEETLEMCRAVNEVKMLLDRQHQPTGYNVGFNAHVAAGQTVMHAHLHIIPRYNNDVPDPRGGIRWVIPARAAYWKLK